MIPREHVRKRQAWVLRHPCRRVEDCGGLGYRADYPLPDGRVLATVVTIDFFDAPLAWHATTAIMDPVGKQATPVAQWTPADRAALLDIAASLLEGVGGEAIRHEEDGLSLGLAKQLTARETEAVYHVLGLRPPKARAVGEIGVFDFRDKRTEASENAHVPQEREIIYEF